MTRSMTAALVASACLLAAVPAAASVTSVLAHLNAYETRVLSASVEKLARTGFVSGVPRAGVPPLAMSGRISGAASPDAVAATWDAQDARDYGRALAHSARTVGIDVLPVAIGPFSSDSYLASRTIAPVVRGVQSEHVIAAVFGRTGGSTDPRTIHERDWPAIEAAIVSGHAGAVTCVLRDGRVAAVCTNRRAFAAMLQHDVRFDGFAVGVPSRDLTSAFRVVGTLARVGVLSHPPHYIGDPPPPAALSRRIVQNGTVLLRNDGSVLPFNGVQSLAVIGDPELSAALRTASPSVSVTDADVAHAVAAAQKATAVVLVLGAAETADESALVESVARANPRTAVVLERDAVGELSWQQAAHAILLSWKSTRGTAPALANLLLGRAAPSGHLPRPVGGFPTGAGLSYTTFAAENLAVSYGRGKTPVTVSFDIRNTGTRSGTAVPQLYLGTPAAAAPRLVAFARVALEPGRSRKVSFALNARSFAVWSPSYKAWFVAPGTYAASISTGSGEAPLTGFIRIVPR